jgi:hypothetical protein
MPAEDRLSTEDGEFRSRTAESKQRLPQLFWVYSPRSVTFSTSDVYWWFLVDFLKVIITGVFFLILNQLLTLPRFGTLGESRPVVIVQAGNLWSCTIMTFVDYVDEILQNWFQIN